MELDGKMGLGDTRVTLQGFPKTAGKRTSRELLRIICTALNKQT